MKKEKEYYGIYFNDDDIPKLDKVNKYRKEVKIKLSPLKKGMKGRGRRRMKDMTSIILPSPIDFLLILLLFSKRNRVCSDQKKG